jgi:hypothetical protein
MRGTTIRRRDILRVAAGLGAVMISPASASRRVRMGWLSASTPSTLPGLALLLTYLSALGWRVDETSRRSVERCHSRELPVARFRRRPCDKINRPQGRGQTSAGRSLRSRLRAVRLQSHCMRSYASWGAFDRFISEDLLVAAESHRLLVTDFLTSGKPRPRRVGLCPHLPLHLLPPCL